MRCLLLLALAVAVAASETQEGASSLLEDVQAVTAFSNRLVPKLYQALAPGRDNVVFAPFGLASNLAMLLEAARGATEAEMLAALGLGAPAAPAPAPAAAAAAATRERLRRGFKAYFDTFEHAAAASAESGEAAGAFNSATLRTAALLSPEYKTLLAKYYRTNVTQAAADEGGAGAGAALELRSDTGVMSHWRDYQRLGVFTFLSQRGAAPFHRGPGDSVAVPMVPQVGVFRAGRLPHLNSSAVELQLQVADARLLLLVPDAADALDELLVRLSGERLEQLSAQLPWGEREVALPQMAVLSAGLDLVPFLRQLGVRAALNASAADLGAALQQPQQQRLFVKAVKQDAYFSTSFVAVNSVGSVSAHTVTKRHRRDTDAFVIDRPFLFMLMHRDTQLVLLAGKIANPTQVP